MRYGKNKYWYFRRFDQDRYYNHTFYTNRDKSKHFVKEEFFKFDKNLLEVLANKYRNEYGTKAYNYLKETFHKWKNGQVRISDQTVERILKFVPRLLPLNKQYQLLKLEISSFIEKTTVSYNYQNVNTKNLEEHYIKYIEKIHKFNADDLRWFVKGSFEEEELSEFIVISKFVLEKKLQQSINQVKHDISVINGYLDLFEDLFFEITYRVDLLGVTILINGENVSHPNVNFLYLNKRFDKNNLQINDIIIDEILKISYSENKGQIDGALQEYDILKVVGKARELNEMSREFVIDSNLKGRGGFLNLKLEKIQASKFLYGFIVNILLIVVNIFLILFFIYLHTKYKLPKNSGCYIFLGWVAVVWFSGYHLLIQIRKSKENLFNFKKYGKRK